MKFQDINIRDLPIKKIVYILMICIFLVCLAVCVSLPINSNNPDFAMNAYFLPGFGVVGALLFKRKWFITPIIVFAFSAVSFAIQFSNNIGIATLQLSLCYAAPSLIGCLIAVLLRFVIQKKKRNVWIIIQKTLSASLAVIMIGGVLLSADSIAGNPISKGIAKSRLTQYLNEVYPDAVIQGDVYYNFIDTNYNLRFNLDGEEKYISYSHGKIRDENVIVYFDKKFAKDFASVEKSVETDTIDISAFIATYVDASGKYITDTERSTNNILYLSINCTDSAASDEKSKETAAKVTLQVLDAIKDSYSISMVDVVYSDNFGTYTIELGEKFTFERLLNNTYKNKSN